MEDPQSVKKNVVWLGLTSLLNDASSEMIMALLPLFLVDLGASRSLVGLIEGVAEATASIFKVVSGWISDRLQARKGLVVVGYTLSTAIKPFIALANTWYQVLAVRFFDRIGKGVRNAPRDALVADSVEENERGRSFGLQRGMDTAGAVIGTLLASGFLYLFTTYTKMPVLDQYRTIFWISVIPGILAVLTVAVLVKDVAAKPAFVKTTAGISFKNLDSGFRAFLIASAVFELSNFSYAIFILRAADLGVMVALIPIIYLVYNLIYAGLSQPLGVMADIMGKKLVLFMGYLLSALMLLGFAFAAHPLHAWILFIIYGVAMAITQTTPRALLADLVPAQMRGTSYGIYYTLIGLIALPASAIAGLLWDRFTPALAFSYGAALAAAAAVLVMVIIPSRKLTKGA
ncbi:MFS transporter [Candidatus Saganbacteria bacterium]|nr:MFS transporter [Candidatus Saganbacteria bacterium]